MQQHKSPIFHSICKSLRYKYFSHLPALSLNENRYCIWKFKNFFSEQSFKIFLCLRNFINCSKQRAPMSCKFFQVQMIRKFFQQQGLANSCTAMKYNQWRNRFPELPKHITTITFIASLQLSRLKTLILKKPDYRC